MKTSERANAVANDLLRIQRDGPVVTLTLNRPEVLNALSRALCRELTAAFRRINDDQDVRAVVLTGSGRAFCAGMDLQETASAVVVDLVLEPEFDFSAQMLACPWPVIAAVNGFAIAGGLEVVLMCDVVYASTDARFADTHARVGLIPGWGLSQRLSRTIGLTRAKELSLTGNFIDAPTAERWALVNRVYAPDELLAAAQLLARDMAGVDPQVLRDYKRVIDEGFGLRLPEGLHLEADANRRCLDRIGAAVVARGSDAVRQRGRKETAK